MLGQWIRNVSSENGRHLTLPGEFRSKRKTGVMHKANWSTSHIYSSHCLTLVLTSPSKPDITIHTLFTWQKSGRRSILLCASFPVVLWWLILCVNLTQPWDAKIIGQTLSLGVSMRVFFIRVLSKSVDWIKHIAFPNVGGASSNQLKACTE